MKELYLAIPDLVLGYAKTYPLITCVVLGLLPIAIVAPSRNVVGLCAVGCGSVVGFALAFLLSRVAGGVSGWWFAAWGILWLIALAFLAFGRPAPGIVSTAYE